jgi:hypothetical protein
LLHQGKPGHSCGVANNFSHGVGCLRHRTCPLSALMYTNLHMMVSRQSAALHLMSQRCCRR